jgi:hypothetical protein
MSVKKKQLMDKLGLTMTVCRLSSRIRGTNIVNNCALHGKRCTDSHLRRLLMVKLKNVHIRINKSYKPLQLIIVMCFSESFISLMQHCQISGAGGGVRLCILHICNSICINACTVHLHTSPVSECIIFSNF